MPEIQNLWLFIAAGLLLNITPGPDMMYVATRSTVQGKMAGLVSALSISTGCLVHIFAAALGLSAIFKVSPIAFLIVKLCGAVYLIYLGIRHLLISKSDGSKPEVNVEKLSSIFLQGITVSILNPKVALFFLSFLPQFVDPAAGSTAVQIIFLGMIFDIGGTLILLVVAFFFSGLGRWLSRHPLFDKLRNRFAGSVYLAMGLSVLFLRRD